MTTEYRGRTDWHREREAEAEEKRAEAKRLRAEGWSVRQIAEHVDRAPQTVRDWFWEPGRVFTNPRPDQARVTRREKAELMAAVYDDPERQNWIRKQMGVERDAGT